MREVRREGRGGDEGSRRKVYGSQEGEKARLGRVRERVVRVMLGHREGRSYVRDSCVLADRL